MLRGHLDKLAKLVLHPLLPHLAGSQRWIISPDGSLWLAPWRALPLLVGLAGIDAQDASGDHAGSSTALV